MTRAIYRTPDMQARLGISEATLYRRRQEAGFPKPFKIGPRLIAWLASDVDAYIESLAAAANGVQA